MTTKETFLPADYSLPKSGSSYTKLEKGKTKIRIVSAPLLGWIDWTEEEGKKKPLRFAYENKPEPLNPAKPVKHFWAFKVWNYNVSAVQILEITQATIQGAIKTLVESEDWGSPVDYDLTIERTGDNLETKYQTTPTPPKDLTDEIQAKVEEVRVDLEKLLAGLDPFEFEETSKEVDPDQEQVDLSEIGM